MWSVADQEHVGLCAEFASLSFLAKTPESALRGIRKAVTDGVRDMKRRHEKIPESLADRNYSGKFMVRVPPELHRQLSIEAEEQKVSLNRLVSAKLAKTV